ncbi:MAG: 4'-phosphopantetheinyl transferase, partial [Maribacter sp.]
FFNNHLNLQFNVSHSKGIGLLAFTHDADIGVDLEPVNKEIDVQKLAARFFSSNESKTVLSLPYAEQFPAFFRCWTRKEAFIKAHGEGLSLALDSFEVSVLEMEDVEMIAIRWGMEEVKEWRLFSFEVEVNLMAGLVVKKEVDEIKFFLR